MRAGLMVAAVCAATAAMAAEPGVRLELNKLEPRDKACRIYVVVGNDSATTYQAFKTELILFRPDGVIERRIAVDLAPVRPSKTTVKSFDLDGSACDGIGSVLLNDVTECKSEGTAIEDCASRVTVSSRASVPLTR
ncbi:MAG: hypothetical protein U1E62_22030 [Alsobacter sp.]